MSNKLAVYIGSGLVAAALTLAGPAEASGHAATPGHSVSGQGFAGARVGIQPTSLSADTSVTETHEWTNFVGSAPSSIGQSSIDHLRGDF